MANITLQIPDAALNRIVDGICDAYNYTLAIEGMQNPPTRGQFAKQQIINFIKTTVRNQEVNAAIKTTEATKNAEIESVSIT